MAENTTEDTKLSVNKNDMSETPPATSANEAVSSDGEKGELDKASTSKEDADVKNETIATDTDLLDKEKQNTFKTDCNGDSAKEETKSGNMSSEKIEEIKENLEEFSSTEARSDNQEVKKCLLNVDKKLNEILKVVHGDLQMEMLQKVTGASTTAKDNDEESNEKDQQTVRKEEITPEDNAVDSSKKYTASLKSTESERDSRSFSMRAEEKSEIGIVGSPTTISELINEEELRGDSALSVDQKDHIVEWVENSVKVNADEENNIAEECQPEMYEKDTMETTKQQKLNDIYVISSKKSQKIVSNIIKKSIKCLNRMHAMEGAAEGRRRQVDTAEDDKTPKSSSSSEIPQSQQNGAALPEETAAAPAATVSRVRTKRKAESPDVETPETKSGQLLAGTSRQKVAVASGSNVTQRHAKVESVESKKRKSTNGQLSVNPRKKFCNEDEREEYISQIVGNDNETVNVLMVKADRLRADIAALENLAHAKEMEWNEILRKRKLKEEAYARLERKIQMTAYMESDSQLPDPLPLATSSLESAEWDNSDNTISREKSFDSKEDLAGERSLDSLKREKAAKVSPQQRIIPPKTNGESNRKRNQASSPESRQIGEGRQGAIVDVRSIIADHRLKHPETVPRRGRRMRNSVNVGLGAGGAMVETGHNTDSRPSSTESCKSNPSTNDSMNYKDILVQFAKMSQQGEGAAAKIPQNYPDVTLHPVAIPSSAAQNTASQPTGSLLHGILTKAQSPRSTTFSPTLARLLTAPERERNSPAAAAAAAVASMSQQSATTQHFSQTYQGSNLVSINDILSSSKARTEITITPVVNSSAQSHSNDLIQVEDVEEETTVIDDRKGSSTSGRDGKQVAKDNPPSPSAPPKCQGCMIRPAQFVCAGCGNQWYCSRTCQLAAWATHSEYCSDYPLESENSKIKPNV
ncbi:uncharacterized protein LOC126857103 isoform X1 [Cataglyphis hispanica]|uniref:uncharacterized protein LOC126857103 isoform X1 n=1 Tax=Cataglyphis hispanica TaxID=1086592 RepID=UPI00217FE7BE|nr:uncharacterized protein LOC126857103 isoform X1 [Cataglyphis hispanica]XP_050462183.1 uncharacterized protein LOC126857103 isoform X1 [Cataglyphis hispanica]